MKVILFIYPDASVHLTPEERSGIPNDVGAWIDETTASGVREQGHAFEPPEAAISIRVRDGQLDRRPGPVVAAEPHLAGFNILECRDTEEAADIAAKHPMARYGIVEVRAFDES
jgi:hypothetical protein